MFRKRNKIVQGLIVVLLLTFLLTGISLTVFAAGNEAAVTIRINQTFSVNSSRWKPDSRFVYVLSTEDAGTPMPEDAVNGAYRFTIQDTSCADVGAITYDRAGKYVYTVRQIIPSAQTGYTYDDEVYNIVVTVRNQTGGGLSATVELPVNQEGCKENEIRFENSYYKAVPNDSDNSNDSKNSNDSNDSNGSNHSNDSNNPKRIKTGDNSDLTLWITMIAGSFVCLLILFWKRRKGKKGVQS